MTRRIIGLAIFAAFLVIWELAARNSTFLALLISSPSRLWVYGQGHAHGLALDTLHTFAITAAGLSVALLVGSALGILGLSSAAAGRFLEGVSTIAQSVPLIVFAPFAIIVFGVGFTSQTALASIMATFPVVIGVIASVRAARSEFEELLVLHNVPFLGRIFGVYLPFALPSLASTLRISAALAILGAVIAEFTGSAVGLGRNIFLGTVRLEPELIMISLLLTSAFGAVTHLVLSKLEQKASWWR